jgi:hypothetical protein
MNPPPKLTPEQGERLRELYRKNFAALVLLPPEAVRDEFPNLAPTHETSPNGPQRGAPGANDGKAGSES